MRTESQKDREPVIQVAGKAEGQRGSETVSQVARQAERDGFGGTCLCV